MLTNYPKSCIYTKISIFVDFSYWFS